MHLEITAERMIIDVQTDFGAAYPFLKIEFLNNGVQYNNHVSQQKISNQLKIKNASRDRVISGGLEITDYMTVAELENTLMNRFGLYAQVFRKSGNIWLETTLTDKWTLKQQNDHGRELSQESISSKEEKNEDFDLTRDAEH